jgi:hypothetical protein
MTRADLESRLARAEAAITLAAKHVRQQKELLADMEGRGHDAMVGLAEALLGTLEESMRLHLELRDHLKWELDADG